MIVIVPDPDNERGVRAIHTENGRIVATGWLEVVNGDEMFSNVNIDFGTRFDIQFVAEKVTP